MKIILNEKEYAEECLKNNDIGESPYFTLSILARYYYHCYGYRKKRIMDLLSAFLKDNCLKYDVNIFEWENTIERIASHAGKYKLFESDGVWITEAELLTIESLSNKVLERLAFTLLCLAKYLNQKNQMNNNWVNFNAKEIFTLARVSCGIRDRYLKLNKLKELGLIEFPKRNDNLNCRVTYLNDESEKKILISDFRELGYEYLNYRGEKFFRCRECGKLTRKTARNQCYCSMCTADESDTKFLVCEDCGKRFEVMRINKRTTRCKECQGIRETELNRIRAQKKRERDRCHDF